MTMMSPSDQNITSSSRTGAKSLTKEEDQSEAVIRLVRFFVAVGPDGKMASCLPTRSTCRQPSPAGSRPQLTQPLPSINHPASSSPPQAAGAHVPLALQRIVRYEEK